MSVSDRKPCSETTMSYFLPEQFPAEKNKPLQWFVMRVTRRMKITISMRVDNGITGAMGRVARISLLYIA